MKFEEALKAMRSGSKAKLPSWRILVLESRERNNHHTHKRRTGNGYSRNTERCIYTSEYPF